MGVGHALGRAGGARGEAEAAGRGFIEIAPDRVAGGVFEQRLERRRIGIAAVDQQQMRDPRRAFAQLVRERGQIGAGDQDARFGLARHRGELGRGQARIEGVADRAHPHDRIPGLDMGLAVPGEGGDMIAATDTEPGEHARDLQAALHQRRIADPVDPAVLAPRHHLRPRVPAGCVAEEFIERKREELHFPVGHRHSGTPAGSGGETMPTFQCQGMPPCARRRQTTCSLNSNMPGRRLVPGRGVAAKAM